MRRPRRTVTAIFLAIGLALTLAGPALGGRQVGGTPIPVNFGTHMACMGMGASGPHMPITGDGCWSP